MKRAITGVLFVWALGAATSEPVAQIGAGLALLLCLVLAVRGRVRLSPWLRPFAFASVALAGWQAVSPALALLSGAAAAWPGENRYLQFLDTLAPLAVAILGALHVPWLAVLGVLLVGWVVNVAAGVHQHFVPWYVKFPEWLRMSPARVREVMVPGESPRHAAGGLFFHRLRFAHGALAMIGPLLAVGASTRRPMVRAAAAFVVVALLGGIYVSFARAALVAAAVMVMVAAVWMLRAKARALVVVSLLVLAAVVLSSSAWRGRIARMGEEYVSGSRSIALRAGLELVRQHPLLGVGFGNHQKAALARTKVPGLTPLTATSSHNLWVMSWAETGMPGLLLTLAFHATLALALWRRVRERHLLAAGAMLAFVGYHLLSLTHYLPFHPGTALGFALIWGLGLAPAPPADLLEFRRPRRPRARFGRRTEAVILLERRQRKKAG